MPRVESPRNGRSRRHASRGDRRRVEVLVREGVMWSRRGAARHLGRPRPRRGPSRPASNHDRSGQGPLVERHHGIGHRVEREALLELPAWPRGPGGRARRRLVQRGHHRRRPARPDRPAAPAGPTSRPGPGSVPPRWPPRAPRAPSPRPGCCRGPPNATAPRTRRPRTSRSGTSSRGTDQLDPARRAPARRPAARAGRSGCPYGHRSAGGPRARPGGSAGQARTSTSRPFWYSWRAAATTRGVVSSTPSARRTEARRSGPGRRSRAAVTAAGYHVDVIRTDPQTRTHHRRPRAPTARGTGGPAERCRGRRPGPPRASTASAPGWPAARVRRPR